MNLQINVSLYTLSLKIGQLIVKRANVITLTKLSKKFDLNGQKS